MLIKIKRSQLIDGYHFVAIELAGVPVGELVVPQRPWLLFLRWLKYGLEMGNRQLGTPADPTPFKLHVESVTREPVLGHATPDGWQSRPAIEPARASIKADPRLARLKARPQIVDTATDEEFPDALLGLPEPPKS